MGVPTPCIPDRIQYPAGDRHYRVRGGLLAPRRRRGAALHATSGARRALGLFGGISRRWLAVDSSWLPGSGNEGTMGMSSRLSMSVAGCTRNRPGQLTRALESLLDQ